MTSTIDATTTDTPATRPSPARALVCRGCGAEYPLIAQHACFECFGPLEVAYDPAGRVTLDPGLTPLVAAPNLAAELGIRAPLWVKDDSANPTHSFKDRVV